jgi:hypothetical protein
LRSGTAGRRPSVAALLVAAIAVGALGGVADGSPLHFGNATVQLIPGCRLSYQGSPSSAQRSVEVNLPNPETCAFVTIGHTNIVRVERYWDAWVLLVQSYTRSDLSAFDPRFGCSTQFKAVVVRDDGELFVSRETNGGTGCPPIDRDRLAFVTLADPYVLKR